MPVIIILMGVGLSIFGITMIVIEDVVDLFGVIVFAIGCIIAGVGLGLDAVYKDDHGKST